MMDIGLLLNFGMNTMKEGIVRVVNNYHPSASSAVSAGDKNKLQSFRRTPPPWGRIFFLLSLLQYLFILLPWFLL